MEAQPTLAVPDDRETAQADREVKHLKKTLGRLDIVFLIVAAVVSIETLGQVSGFGAETFTWALVLAVFFLLPYGLIFAETGGAFTGEGGVYVWCRKAFGRPIAAIASLLTWVTQPVWVGGSMAFIASETWNTYVTPFESGSLTDYIFKLVFIWLTVLAAIISLRHGKWIPNAGAILKIAFLVDLPGDHRDLRGASWRRGPVGQRFQPDGGGPARRDTPAAVLLSRVRVGQQRGGRDEEPRP